MSKNIFKKIILLVIVIIICFYILCFFKKETNEKNIKVKDQSILINILTRSGKREQCFNNLAKSIKNQTYKNIRHIISNDNPQCKYLHNKNNVVNVKKLKKYNINHCPYNLYLNNLKNKVKKGWIIILDDDSKLIDNTFIERLVYQIKKLKKHKAIIFDSYIGNNLLGLVKIHIPNIFGSKNFDINLIKYKRLDMTNIAFHHSVNIDFSEACGGDFIFFKKLLEKNLVKYIKIEPGIWANYEGASNGGELICHSD